MEQFYLDGKWQLYYFKQTEVEIEPAMLVEMSSILATVPGNVEFDLIQAGILPEDLYYSDNILSVQQYEEYEWWYQKSFSVPQEWQGKRLKMIFHGVDCLATYWINGEKIGFTDNMLIEHEFNVSNSICYGKENTITIRLSSPIIEAMKYDYPALLFSLQTNMESLYIRKVPHSYGWDIMPRALSAGLWRSVEIVVQKEQEIENVYLYTKKLGNKDAQLGLYYKINSCMKPIKNLKVRISGVCGDSHFTKIEKLTFNVGTISFAIDNPKLWWPLGYGNADLYAIKVELLAGEEVIDTKEFDYGIRTVELIRTDSTEMGSVGEFLFKVNDVPIFCKGSNSVPMDAFHSRDAQRYKDVLDLFIDNGCNMLRCWGGSVYEDHKFYDICDRNGIMVWQDFGMGCALYPNEKEFHEKIRKEAESVIKKLRNHSSIVLWSGDNEIDAFMMSKGYKPSINKITREILPQVVAYHDPMRPFLPSSPYVSKEVEENGSMKNVPENHLWEPRDYYKSKFYTETNAHFISEIGYHGCPNLSSIKQFIEPEYLWPWQDNEQWIIHSAETLGKEGFYAYRIKLMADQIKQLFGTIPENIEDFVIASQISQAEAMKFFMEMVRLKKWRTTGMLWWNMIDGWPQFSDAVVDYYFGKKLAYHYLKRVQQPVCIMLSEPDDWHLTAVVGNDTNHPVTGTYRIWEFGQEGNLLEGSFEAPANQNATLGKIRTDSYADKRLFFMEWFVDGKKYGNHYMLGYPAFSLEEYKAWLASIAQLDGSFEAENVGK